MVILTIMALCLFLNALFASFELAFVTISLEQVDELIQKQSQLKFLVKIKKNPERTLSTLQLGVTFVAAMAATVGGMGAIENLEPYLVRRWGLNLWLAEVLSVGIVIVPLTYLSVVFGELVPKGIALRYPELVLRWVGPVIYLLEKLFSPIVSLLESSTKKLLGLLGFPPANKVFPVRRVRIENLESYHQKYVLNLVALKGIKNEDILVPWSEVVWIDFGDSYEVVQEKITVSRHTRLPVMTQGQVMGLLHTKEFQALPRDHSLSWQTLLRPVLNVSPHEKVLETFTQMQQRRNHLAIVKGRQDWPLGILTMENIIEEILGDIEDEDDDNRMQKILNKRASRTDLNAH